MLIGGAAALLFSFMELGETGGEGGGNAWDEFGLITLAPILCAAIAALVAVEVFGSGNVPKQVLGLELRQLQLTAGFAALLIVVGFYQMFQNLADFAARFSGISDLEIDVEFSAMWWLMCIGVVSCVVGAVMELKASPTSSTGPAAAPSPF